MFIYIYIYIQPLEAIGRPLLFQGFGKPEQPTVTNVVLQLFGKVNFDLDMLSPTIDSLELHTHANNQVMAAGIL